MIAQLYRQVWKVLWLWWTADRIRASPAEGRLLRIQPGDLLTVAGVDAQVLGASVDTRSEGGIFRIACSTELGSGELIVPITPESSPELIWCSDAGSRRLTADNIQVWSRRKTAR